MTENYQVPEKIKFLLQNLNYLMKSEKLTNDELTKCREMFDTYIAQFKDTEDAVCVLEIKASSPPVLNSVLGNYDLDTVSLEIVKRKLKDYQPNLEVTNNIPAKDISIKEMKDFDYEKFTDELDNTNYLVF